MACRHQKRIRLEKSKFTLEKCISKKPGLRFIKVKRNMSSASLIDMAFPKLDKYVFSSVRSGGTGSVLRLVVVSSRFLCFIRTKKEGKKH